MSRRSSILRTYGRFGITAIVLLLYVSLLLTSGCGEKTMSKDLKAAIENTIVDDVQLNTNLYQLLQDPPEFKHRKIIRNCDSTVINRYKLMELVKAADQKLESDLRLDLIRYFDLENKSNQGIRDFIEVLHEYVSMERGYTRDIERIEKGEKWENYLDEKLEKMVVYSEEYFRQLEKYNQIVIQMKEISESVNTRLKTRGFNLEMSTEPFEKTLKQFKRYWDTRINGLIKKQELVD